MSFNVKSWLVDAVVDSVLAKPSGSRHGITGFWRASLDRVRNERIVVAFRNARAFTEAFKSNGRNSVWYGEDQ